MKTWRAYVIGFAPPGEAFDKEVAARRMRGADFCMQSPGHETVPIGEVWVVGEVYSEGDGNSPPIGTTVRCVAHEHSGKIVVVEEVARPS